MRVAGRVAGGDLEYSILRCPCFSKDWRGIGVSYSGCVDAPARLKLRLEF